MRNRVRPLAGAAGDFAARKLRRSVARIDFQLLLEFFFRLLRVGLGVAFGERNASQAEMNPRYVGVLVEDFVVLRRRFRPAALRLEGLGLQFLGLIGSWRFSRKLLGSLHGQLGKIVRGDVENFGIAREVAL